MVRFKHRYFTIEVVPVRKSNTYKYHMSSSELFKSILRSVQHLHGDFGVASVMSGFRAKYCNPVTRLGVIRARHGPHRLVASSLLMIKDIHKVPVTVRILYTGATLKHCFKFAVKHQKHELMRMWNSLPNDRVRQEVKKSIMDLSPFKGVEKTMIIPDEHDGAGF